MIVYDTLRVYKDRLKKNFLSLFVYLRILSFQRVYINALKSIAKVSHSTVHIVCPGPSVSQFFKAVELLKVDSNDAVVFVNHGIKYASELKDKVSCPLFFITADGTRLGEIIRTDIKNLKLCTSVLSPIDLYHLDSDMFGIIDVIVLPKASLSKTCVIQGRSSSPENIRPIEWPNVSFGFGSLISAVQLALLLKPKNIEIWGADLSDGLGKRYADSSVPVRKTQSFNKTRADLMKIEENLKKRGVRVNRNV